MPVRQQLNLYDPRFAPTRQRFSARQGLAVMALVLVGGWLGSQGVQWATLQAQRQTEADQAALASLRGRIGPLTAQAGGGPRQEVARLQALDAEQRQVRAALEAGAAGVREGHADYLTALARQASGRVWITGFSVSEDGQSIDLEGRMTDSTALADWLRQLNNEPRLRGRPFAQLSLTAVDTQGGALPYTAFVLRSAAPTDPRGGRTP